METMKLFLSRVHFPVTTLGHGRRVGIWFQGCSIRCPGCLSRDTWEQGRGETTVASLAESIAPFLPEADGLTVSGGEPFDQPAALDALLRWVRPRLRPEADILVYSGYPLEHLLGAGRAALSDGSIDLLISDPYEAAAGQTLALRGSDNQRVHGLTELARQRYASLPGQRRGPADQALDLVIEGESAWMAGIPAPGFLEQLRTSLEAAGLRAQATSEGPSVFA
jgi:anaerobic ribonucleoside-triphosphate reductase activating protein